jgi:uroporphyrinogen-III synthase
MKKISNILISQPEPATRSPYFAVAEKLEINIDFKPFIVVERVSNKEFRKQRVDLNTYPAVTFTSRNAMDYYFQMMEEMRATVSQETRYFCMSEAIALYLQKYIQYRKRKVFFANGTFEDFKRLLLKYKAAAGRFLVPCTDVRNDELSNFLMISGFEFKECVMYRTVNAELAEMDIYKYDMIVFFSPAGIQSLFNNFPDFKQGDIRIAGFGPNTCDRIEEVGLRLDLRAPVPEARSMSAALERYLEGK